MNTELKNLEPLLTLSTNIAKIRPKMNSRETVPSEKIPVFKSVWSINGREKTDIIEPVVMDMYTFSNIGKRVNAERYAISGRTRNQFACFSKRDVLIFTKNPPQQPS
jgi:hypothetical protein